MDDDNDNIVGRIEFNPFNDIDFGYKKPVFSSFLSKFTNLDENVKIKEYDDCEQDVKRGM